MEGYKRIWNNGKSTHFTLHRLLAVHFIPNPNNLPFVNHIDENKLNNSINNLEWCTQAYIDTGISYKNKKFNHYE